MFHALVDSDDEEGGVAYQVNDSAVENASLQDEDNDAEESTEYNDVYHVNCNYEDFDPVRSFDTLGECLLPLLHGNAALQEKMAMAINATIGVKKDPSLIQANVFGALYNTSSVEQTRQRDVLAISHTGSGKTLAFVIPAFVSLLLDLPALFEKCEGRARRLELFYALFTQLDRETAAAKIDNILKKYPDNKATNLSLFEKLFQNYASDIDASEILAFCCDKTKGSNICRPRVLILAPTRELAKQIQEVVDAFHTIFWCIPSLALIGGVDINSQREQVVECKPMILVATPGRLLSSCGVVSQSSLLRHNYNHSAVEAMKPVVGLSAVELLVIDECDRLLDCGFQQDLDQIRRMIPQRHQSLLTSATLPPEVTTLVAEVLLPKYVHITVSRSSHSEYNIVQTVRQEVVVLSKKSNALSREKRLLELLLQHQQEKVLIFVLFKKEAKELCLKLQAHQLDCDYLHGDRSQTQRSQVLDSFRKGQPRILVATDVAARGIDVPDVECVINYSFGLSVDHYIHRVGRCGRAGRSGVAYTFFLERKDQKFAPELVKVLRECNQMVPEELSDACKKELRARQQQQQQQNAGSSEEEDHRRLNREKQLAMKKAVKMNAANRRSKRR